MFNTARIKALEEQVKIILERLDKLESDFVESKKLNKMK